MKGRPRNQPQPGGRQPAAGVGSDARADLERRENLRRRRAERRLTTLFNAIDIGDVVPLRRVDREQVRTFAAEHGYKIAWEESARGLRFYVLATPRRAAQSVRILQGGAVESKRRVH